MQYACWSNDEAIRFSSTSGGAFISIAQAIVDDGGTVFGAVYNDDFSGVHHASSDEVALSRMQKSKYVISDLRDSFMRIIQLAEHGKTILFVGTPCQCAGLKPLVEHLENVFLIDFICGGTPSARCFKEYIDLLKEKFRSNIENIDFRGKERGWGKNYLKIKFKNGKVYNKAYLYDPYYSFFYLEHLTTNACCTECNFRRRHASDLTIADFWGYTSTSVPNDKKGISLVAVNTEKGKMLFHLFNNKSCYELTQKEIEYAYQDFTPSKDFIEKKNKYFELLCEKGFQETVKQFSHTGKLDVFIKRLISKLER